MRLYQYINEGNDLSSLIDKVSHFNYKELEKFLRGKFKEFMDNLPSGLETPITSMINKAFGTHYKYLEDIYDEKVPPLREGVINEDVSHWWEMIKSEGFPALAFYPALNVWLEIDKFLRGQDINMRVVIAYSILWVLLISGKYVKGYMDWKKRNPDEYNKERQQGKGGLI